MPKNRDRISRRPSREAEPNPSPEEFEEFVAAALKVDPKGLSGKHRREADDTPRPMCKRCHRTVENVSSRGLCPECAEKAMLQNIERQRSRNPAHPIPSDEVRD